VGELSDLKMEKVRNFLRNYLESEKFFSKFSYFLGRKGKGKGKFSKHKSDLNLGLGVLSSSKKVSENKNKTNYLINLE